MTSWDGVFYGHVANRRDSGGRSTVLSGTRHSVLVCMIGRMPRLCPRNSSLLTASQPTGSSATSRSARLPEPNAGPNAPPSRSPTTTITKWRRDWTSCCESHRESEIRRNRGNGNSRPADSPFCQMSHQTTPRGTLRWGVQLFGGRRGNPLDSSQPAERPDQAGMRFCARSKPRRPGSPGRAHL